MQGYFVVLASYAWLQERNT